MVYQRGMPKGNKTFAKGRVSFTLQLPCGRVYQGSEKTTLALRDMHAKGCDLCAKALAGGGMVTGSVHSAPGMTACDELAHNIKARQDKLTELKNAPYLNTLTTNDGKAVNWRFVETTRAFQEM